MTMTLTGSAMPSQICLGPVQSFADRLCRVDALAKKQVRPRVDEERGFLLLRRRANGRDPPRLPVDVVESRSFDDPVLKVDPDHAQIEKTRDVIGQLAVIFTIPAFDVHGDGGVNGRRDPRDDLLSELDRDGLAVSVSLRLRDRPAACRDCLRTRLDDGFGTARIPCIVEQQGAPFTWSSAKRVAFSVWVISSSGTGPCGRGGENPKTATGAVRIFSNLPPIVGEAQ
jgi:hypothetical protein